MSIEQRIIGSDHAPLNVLLDFNMKGSMSKSLLLESASNLGQSHFTTPPSRFVCSGPSFRCVNIDGFKQSMNLLTPPDLNINADMNMTLVLDN